MSSARRTPRRRRLGPPPADRADGFTLIEVLVVILVIGVLAALALPTFIGQSEKAHDVTAKAAARNLVTHVEACHALTEDWTRCASGDPDLEDVAGTDAMATTDMGGYVVIAASSTGATFRITKHGGSVERTCAAAASARGGCDAGHW